MFKEANKLTLTISSNCTVDVSWYMLIISHACMTEGCIKHGT